MSTCPQRCGLLQPLAARRRGGYPRHPCRDSPQPGATAAMEHSPSTPGALQRRTNWWGAFVIGLAGTLLVTGIAPYAVQGMGAMAIPFFVLVTAGGVVLCFCLAELAALMPHRTGGLPSYASETYKGF